MSRFLIPGDVPGVPSDAAETLIEDAEALALLAAPCLADAGDDDLKVAQARAILRGVVMRWNEAGSGATQQMAAGPFSQTITSQARRNSFWPSEVKDLQSICKGTDAGKAYSIDTVPTMGGVIHSQICSLFFGGDYCSCAGNITGGQGPLYPAED